MQQTLKRFFIFSVIAACGGKGFSQTLISYGNGVTGKEEFLRAYNKNKPSVSDKEKSMREYLDLYTNFKLKVKAAQELRLDTLAQIRYDVQNFRDQIAGNYLNNEKGMQLLTDEAAGRAAKDIHVIYFSVPVAENAVPADTMKAFAAAKALYADLKKGTAAYAETVTDISAKYSQARFSDAGYVTAFSVPYQFENIIYSTAQGNVSEPVRTTKGWVMFKVISERPDAGRWKVAQVLIAFPPDADYNTKLKVKEKADSVYGLLKNGLAFGEAAKTYSDDRITFLSGGELPEFGSGKYTGAFEDKIFTLKNDNDISAPFETAYGYHIVKRISHTATPDKSDASYVFDLKQKIMQDSRINSERDQFAKDIAVKTGYKRLPGVTDAELFRYADSLAKSTNENAVSLSPVSNKNIMSFRDGTAIKGDEWLKFVRNYRANSEQPKESDKKMWDRFAAQAVTDYYKKHLEDYNSDFKYQMQEFREGNMLFEIMERNVWSKAGADSAGLAAYYNAHKENYKWASSADVIIFNCPNVKSAEESMTLLKAGKSWQSIAENGNGQIQADSGRYEISQLPGGRPAGVPQAGQISAITTNADNTAGFVQYIHLYDAGMQRSFPEARGLVINDYQNVLEERWVAELRKKYPVKVNEAAFKEMLR